MKCNSFIKVSLVISLILLFFLSIVPLTGAEQLNNELTKEVFTVEGLKTLEGSLQEKGFGSALQAIEVARNMVSGVDVKIPLHEGFNAIFSIAKPDIKDLTGRDIGKNYNALIGFQIILR